MIKNIECNPNGCGVYYTIPKKYNENTHEHMEECIKNGWEYREAIVEVNDFTTIFKCPKCEKEGMRVTR